jgi:hypothetical protein
MYVRSGSNNVRTEESKLNNEWIYPHQTLIQMKEAAVDVLFNALLSSDWPATPLVSDFNGNGRPSTAKMRGGGSWLWIAVSGDAVGVSH